MLTKFTLFLPLATLLLSSCATTSSNTNQSPAIPTTTASNISPQVLHQQHMDNIANIKQFSLKGRLGVTKQPKGFSGRLKWQHLSDNEDVIEVFSPFGGKVASIVKTNEQVTLTQNDGESIQERDTATLTKKVLGFRLPLNGLSYWVLGKPNNSIANYMTWDEHGRLNTLQQDGWNIEYKNYKATGTYFLPSKVILKNNQLTLKLLVEQWSDL